MCRQRARAGRQPSSRGRAVGRFPERARRQGHRFGQSGVGMRYGRGKRRRLVLAREAPRVVRVAERGPDARSGGARRKRAHASLPLDKRPSKARQPENGEADRARAPLAARPALVVEPLQHRRAECAAEMGTPLGPVEACPAQRPARPAKRREVQSEALEQRAAAIGQVATAAKHPCRARRRARPGVASAGRSVGRPL